MRTRYDEATGRWIHKSTDPPVNIEIRRGEQPFSHPRSFFDNGLKFLLGLVGLVGSSTYYSTTLSFFLSLPSRSPFADPDQPTKGEGSPKKKKNIRALCRRWRCTTQTTHTQRERAELCVCGMPLVYHRPWKALTAGHSQATWCV